MASEKSCDLAEGSVGWYVCVHANRISDEESGTGWQDKLPEVGKQVLAAFEVTVKQWQEVLEFAIDPCAQVLEEASTAGHNWARLERCFVHLHCCVEFTQRAVVVGDALSHISLFHLCQDYFVAL